MTFEVKLLITFVATHPLVILTKFGQNRMKHVEEEANCEKERKKGRTRDHLCLQADTGIQAHIILKFAF